MRPADPNRERVEQLHINVVDVFRSQFKGLHAYRSSHLDPSVPSRDPKLTPYRRLGLLLRAAQAPFCSSIARKASRFRLFGERYSECFAASATQFSRESS